MTNEEKITHIRTAAMGEARAEANAIIKQHKDALRSVFEQHQIEARRQSETRVRAESVTAKQQLNMAMSKAQLELKREMGKIQTELKTELFEEVQLKLLAFMRTEEYKEVLIRYIEMCIRDSQRLEKNPPLFPSMLSNVFFRALTS